jgi:hypothetical protein
MKDVREAIKRERQGKLDAKLCQCGRWFSTVNSRRTLCFRCEAHER